MNIAVRNNETKEEWCIFDAFSFTDEENNIVRFYVMYNYDTGNIQEISDDILVKDWQKIR